MPETEAQPDQRELPKSESDESTAEEQGNAALDDAASDYFASRKKFHQERGDAKYANLLSQQERVISDMALNPDDAPFGGNERRLVTGSMADALDVFITDKVQFEGEGGKGVEDSERLFRELGKELFGESSSGVEIASTKIDLIKKRFEKVKGEQLRYLGGMFEATASLLEEQGGASKLVKENPVALKEQLESTQLVLAQSLAGSIYIVEQMRMGGEMTAAEANDRSKDSLFVLQALHELQSLIDGLNQKVEANMKAHEDERQVEDATEAANAAADKAEGTAPEVSVEDQENERTASKIGEFVTNLVSVEAEQVLKANEDGSNQAKQYGQFAEVFPQMYPGVSTGEAFRRLAEEIRSKKTEALKNITPEQAYAGQAIAQRIAIDQMFNEMQVKHPDVISALQEASDEEGERQRQFFEDAGISGFMVINLSPKRFLSTLYEQLSQDKII